jgi:mono/diheme cytochrome c family protein
LFQQRCGACHGSSGGLSVKSYADLIKGGAKGAVVIPGNADTSPLTVVQAGSHPGKFSAGEMELVKKWIDAGAPEK